MTTSMSVTQEKSFVCLIQILEKCKSWGYTEVWFNHVNPHWTNSSCMGMIVAAPKHKGGAKSLWSLGNDPLECEVIGSMSCGNGLTGADQGQWGKVSKNIPPSHYKLIDGLGWLLSEEAGETP